MIKIKFDVEKILLGLIFVILLFASATFLGQQIKHDFPYGYFASDAFQHQIRAEAIKDAGDFRYEATYISFGFEGLVGRYPPLVYHLAVLLSHASGLEVYDTIYFILLFFAVIVTLIVYLIIRNFNKNVALISIPFAILIFTFPVSAGFLYGHWPSLLGQFFLIAFAWCITRIDLEKPYVLAGIMLSAVFLAHTAAAVFAILFLFLFFIIRLINKSLKKSEIKNIAIAFALFLIISAYYIIIFLNTWLKAQPYSFSVFPAWEGNPGFYILGFGILLIFIAAGALFSLLKFKEMHVSLIFAFSMLIAGFMNYVGFEVRSFQIRFFWPLYLAVFFGFGIYMLLKFAIRQWSIWHSALVFAVLTLLLTGIAEIPFILQYKKSSSPGVMDSYHWSALKWLAKNAEKGSKVYFLYGDIYGQDAVLRNSKRTHYLVDPNDFVKALQERKIKREYVTELPGDSGGRPVVRRGIFSFEDVVSQKPVEYYFGAKDICRFDYLVFDKASRQQPLAQYNLLIASELLKKEFMKKVFENEIVLILKNSKTGANCIEERSF